MFKFKVTNKRVVLFMIFYPIIAAAILCCVFGGCSYINKKLGLSDDNVVEEIVEEIIEQKTGLDIDLTPESKE